MDEYGTCSCRTFQMKDDSRAKVVEDTDGLVQVVDHHETGVIAGVHMVRFLPPTYSSKPR